MVPLCIDAHSVHCTAPTQTGAEILITGSVDLYLEQVNPEVSISLRAYDCRTHKMIWIDCLSTTGEDQAGLFGIGRLTDLEQLTNKAVKTVLKRMPRFSEQEHKPVRKPSKNDLRLIQQGRIAIVRFDNSTDVPNADAVVTNAMIQEAWQRGFDVVEPGELSRIRTRLASDFQGGIERQRACDPTRRVQRGSCRHRHGDQISAESRGIG